MGKLRDRMPVVDAFIDELREIFGREEIDRSIVEGLRDGSFHARENGHEVGALMKPDNAVSLDHIVRDDGSMFVIHVKRRRRINGTEQAGEE